MKSIVVLGMHRSATSLVSQGLSRAMPPVHMGNQGFFGKGIGEDGNSANDQGFWEDIRYVQLNNALLEAAGGSWHDPPSKKAILSLSPLWDDNIKKLVQDSENEAESYGCKFWGWKDPRTVLTFPLYKPFLKNLHVVSIFRGMDDVVNSLLESSGDDPKKSKEEWEVVYKKYNSRLLSIVKDYT